MRLENRTPHILLGLSEEFIMTLLAFIPAKRSSPDSKFARYGSRRHTACRLSVGLHPDAFSHTMGGEGMRKKPACVLRREERLTELRQHEDRESLRPWLQKYSKTS